mgnify:CR=1 FL=1
MKITTKRALNILGKEEASGSNPDIGSHKFKELQKTSSNYKSCYSRLLGKYLLI